MSAESLILDLHDSSIANLRFNKSQNLKDCSTAHVGISFVSSEILKHGLLKLLLDHPMKKGGRGRMAHGPNLIAHAVVVCLFQGKSRNVGC